MQTPGAVGSALIPVASAGELERQAQAESEARNQATQASTLMSGLGSHVRRRWETARDARRELEERMLRCLRQRNGEYDPDVQSLIAKQGGSDIFVRLTSVKCRGATSWLRDTLLGNGTDKPWAIEATPEPELPEELLPALQQELAAELQGQLEQGMPMPSEGEMREMAQAMKDQAYRMYQDESDVRVERMERKMEDHLIEGGWMKAFNEFIDDIVTFPFAAMKGPIKRRRKVMKWVEGALQAVEVIRNEWERVNPFMLYWAPWSSDINDGFVIERHKLTRDALQALKGVPGYNDDAIDSVLRNFSMQFTATDWLWVDSATAEAEGKQVSEVMNNTDLIDALQLWDIVEGRLLRDWGMTAKDIPDPTMSYPVEVWLIGNIVIRAVLNYDTLGRKHYYVASYENKPGSVDGNGVGDLCRDSQAMVNSSARSLANNMGISSGPQVGIDVSRLPPGEDITDMHPWKIWQFISSEFANGGDPIKFFQPQSNAGELMKVFKEWSDRADEDTMIPKYMTGEHSPGAGRTSSGLAMMISNAGKGIKQVINNIDQNVIVPAIERLYHDLLRYNSQDPDIIGDLQVVAKGASSLVVKEAEAIRRAEFLQIVLNSPIATEIVGSSGAAELLRDAASNLSMNVDKVVPNAGQMTIIEKQAQQIQDLMQQLQMVTEQLNAAPDNVEFTRDDAGNVTGALKTKVAPAPLQSDGSPVGGRDSNQMRNAASGVNG